MSISDVGVRLSVKDRAKFTREMDHAEDDIRGLGGAAEGTESRAGAAFSRMSVVGVAAVAAVGAAVTKFTSDSISAFSDFERQTNEVFTLLPGISATAMGEMRDDVRQFSVDTGTATEEVVPALYQALSAGVPKDNVFAFLETAHQAALGGVTDIETATKALTGTVNAYGADVLSTEQASDMMFTAVAQGVTTFEELSASLSQVTPIAAANEVAFGDLSAAVATMTKQGTPTAQAVTGIRGALVELSDAGSQVGGAFEEVAGKSFKDFMSTGGSLAEALEVVGGVAVEAGVSADQLFGSVDAGTAVLQLTGSQMEGFKSNIDAMANSAGATAAAYETMDTGMGRVMDRVKARWEDVQLAVGERLAPVLMAAGERLSQLWSEHGQPFFAAMTDAWPGVSDAIATFWGYAEPVFGFLGDTLGWLWNNILTPLWNFWTTQVMPDLAASIQQYGPSIIAVIATIGDHISDVWNNVLTPAWNFWVNTAWPQIQAGVEVASIGVTAAIDAIGSVMARITEGAAIFREAFLGVWTQVQAGAEVASTAVVGAIDGIGSVMSRITRGSERFRDAFLDVWQRIVDGVAVAWEFINETMGKVEGVFDRAGRGVDRVAGWIPGIGGGSVAETMAPSTRAPLAIPTASFATAGTAQVTQVTTTDMRTNPTNVHLTVHAVDADSFRRVLQTNRRELAEEVAIAVGRDRVTA